MSSSQCTFPIDDILFLSQIISRQVKSPKSGPEFYVHVFRKLLSDAGGATEIAGLDNDGPTKMQEQDWTMKDD